MARVLNRAGCPLDSRDERDAESILLTIEPEFRRALEAQQSFMASTRHLERALAERLRRYAVWAGACEPFAASYRSKCSDGSREAQ